MADTITIRDASGALVDVSVDDLTTLNGSPVTGIHIQRLKAVFGVDGTGVDVSASNPLPVTLAALPGSPAQEHSTAGSPGAVRLSDGSTYLGSTAQRLHVSDGGVALATTNAALTDGSAQVKLVAPSAAAVTQVSSSATSVTLNAANASRRGLSIYNDSTSALYVKFGATASTSSYTVKLAAGDYYEMPAPYYRGVVDGIWASANGNALVTELS